MKAQRLGAQCPICNRSIEGDMKPHLFEHSKMDLVTELIAYMDAEEHDGEE